MRLLRKLRTKEQWADGVQGRRSPMWALWSKMTIPCPNGEIYLARIRVVQTPWFGILLHDIYEPDQDRHMHDHPWTFWSLILKGGYDEVIAKGGYPIKNGSLSVHTRKRWSLHKMPTTSAHQITELHGPTRTLIFCGPRVRKWGFWTPQGWVHWKDYIHTRDGVRPT